MRIPVWRVLRRHRNIGVVFLCEALRHAPDKLLHLVVGRNMKIGNILVQISGIGGGDAFIVLQPLAHTALRILALLWNRAARSACQNRCLRQVKCDFGVSAEVCGANRFSSRSGACSSLSGRFWFGETLHPRAEPEESLDKIRSDIGES